MIRGLLSRRTLSLLAAAVVTASPAPVVAAPGERDLTFNPPFGHAFHTVPGRTGTDGRGIAVQPDGKVVVVGSIREEENWNVRVARLAADGTPDPSFGRGGAVAWDGPEHAQELGVAVAVQGDGRILVLATASTPGQPSTLLLRLNADGTPDRAFGEAGVVRYRGPEGLGSRCGDLALDAGGRIVLAGSVFDADGWESLLVLRLNPDGSRDRSFGDDGAVVVRAFAASLGAGVAVAGDGGVVATGDALVDGAFRVLTVRLDAAGRPVPGFGPGGLRTWRGPAGLGDWGADVAVQPDGKVVVAGSTQRVAGIHGDDVLVLRYLPSGRLDPAFGAGGVFTWDGPAGLADWACAVGLGPGGRIAVAGTVAVREDRYAQDVLVLAITPEGAPDPAFGTLGAYTFDGAAHLLDAGSGLAAGAAGALLVSGSAMSHPNSVVEDALVLRLDASGAPDAGFGAGGAAVLPGVTGQTTQPDALALQPDGRILVAGRAGQGTTDALLVRFTGDGASDPTFAAGGALVWNGPTNREDQFTGVAVQPDGKVVVAGSTNVAAGLYDSDHRMLVQRYNADGTPDAGFGAGGSFLWQGGTVAGAADVAVQPDGGIVVAGAIGQGGTAFRDLLVLRLTPDGALDPSFGAAGVFTLDQSQPGTPSDEAARAVLLQPDGKILVAGGSNVSGPNRGPLVLRLTAGGALDASFGGGDGIAKVVSADPTLAPDAAADAVLAPDGSVLIVTGTAVLRPETGLLGRDVLVAKFTPAGDLDTAFGEGRGYVCAGDPVENEYGHALALARDGRIVTLAAGPGGALTMRHLADGRPDAAFGGGGAAFWRGARPADLAVDAAGRILMAVIARVVHPQSALAGERLQVVRIVADETVDVCPTGCAHDTIQAGLDAAAPGQTVRLAQGTWYERIALGAPADVRIQGGWGTGFASYSPDPALTSIAGAGSWSGSLVSVEAGAGEQVRLALEGLTLEGGSTTGGGGGVFALAADGGRAEVALERCRLLRNLAVTEGGAARVAAQDGGTASLALTNTLVAGGAAARGGGVEVFATGAASTAEAALLNATVTDNTAPAGGGVAVVSADGGRAAARIDNGIVWGNAPQPGGSDVYLRRDGGEAEVRAAFSDLGPVLNDAPAGTFVDGGGLIDADPLFARPAFRDYRLAAGSLCLDAGAAAGAPAADGRGAVRPQGGGVDLGAYEGAVPPLERLRLRSLNGGETVGAGEARNIVWTAPAQAVAFDLAYSLDAGATWRPITARRVRAAEHSWNLPVPADNRRCLVRLRGYAAGGALVASDVSDRPLDLRVAELTAPRPGAVLASGGEVTIAWRTYATVRRAAAVKLFFSVDRGATWQRIDAGVRIGDTGSYAWHVPAVAGERHGCKIRMVLEDRAGAKVGSAVSPGFFTIMPGAH